MKLKEKMAQTSSFKWEPNLLAQDMWESLGKKIYIEGYLSGFEAAREMAVFISSAVHTETDWKVGHDITNIGEEEVP